MKCGSGWEAYGTWACHLLNVVETRRTRSSVSNDGIPARNRGRVPGISRNQGNARGDSDGLLSADHLEVNQS